MTKQWVLTAEAFDRLLAWLGPDREQAGMKYEDIHHSLVNFFNWRGQSEAEELADETINRVIQKVPELVATYKGDPALYFYGVAKKVLLEYRRREFEKEPLPRWEGLASAGSEPEEWGREFDCLERCLQELSEADRELVLNYYREEKRAKIVSRRDMAETRGYAANNLRVKVHRIRKTLLACMRACLSGGDAG
jgi:DNA-directed RNA polymerase specialized sigma24 family protein